MDEHVDLQGSGVERGSHLHQVQVRTVHRRVSASQQDLGVLDQLILEFFDRGETFTHGYVSQPLGELDVTRGSGLPLDLHQGSSLTICLQ